MAYRSGRYDLTSEQKTASLKHWEAEAARLRAEADKVQAEADAANSGQRGRLAETLYEQARAAERTVRAIQREIEGGK